MTNKQAMAYLKTLLHHKYYVFVSGRELNLGIFRLLRHDWDKFGPKMFVAYAENFYNPDGSKREDAEETEAFKETWNRHQKVSRHHWQAHVRKDDDGTEEIMPMPDVDRREMLADWRGAGRAYAKPENPWTPGHTRVWYRAGKENRQIHPETEAWLEENM